ncbi:hypothetical protein QE152_g36914 [Popillia japonica]|uniref:Uncharacterized protein n=1 Tax=Popillia japonica TaxID=7064 RepID=A0AAW1IC54_POPJA
MKLNVVLVIISLCISGILSTPTGGELESIRARRATSFVCSTCPFVCQIWWSLSSWYMCLYTPARTSETGTLPYTCSPPLKTLIC